jgi:hypothetical protein
MEIVEEVTRRRETLKLEDPQAAYSEIRDLLERRMSFDAVKEERYFHDVEEGTIRSRLKTVEGYDRYTIEEIEIYLFISKEQRELDLQIKAKLITEYETEVEWKNNLWYYAYRALYDKFFYGKVRHGYIPDVEDKADQLLTRLRNSVEAKH